MSNNTAPWDVLIVGARCSGAALAALLARSGLRVLVLEAAAKGTDMPMSTHYLQPPGMEVLDRLGIGDRVRAVTPPTRLFRAALDDEEFIAPLLPDRFGYCVRRSTLDPWLQDTAEASGAEVRYQHKVVDLVHEGGRVVGVVVQGPEGRETIHAGLVVGADGPHSVVARRAGAEEYLVSEGNRGAYWNYYPAPAEWEFPWDSTIEHRGDDIRYVFRTDGDLVVLVAVAPLPEVTTWGAAHRERTREMLMGSPTTRALSEGKEPVGKACGLLKTKYFYRRPVGPGWALVGDAGHFKDFVTGQGMADALMDAERLAVAIIDGREIAFEHFWRERDVATLPLHFDAIRQGAVGYNNALMRWVFSHVAERADIRARMGHVMTRELTPDQLLPTSSLLKWMGEALVRGRFDVLHAFFAFGKALRPEQAEMASRRALLADVTARLAASGVAAAAAA